MCWMMLVLPYAESLIMFSEARASAQSVWSQPAHSSTHHTTHSFLSQHTVWTSWRVPINGINFTTSRLNDWKEGHATYIMDWRNRGSVPEKKFSFLFHNVCIGFGHQRASNKRVTGSSSKTVKNERSYTYTLRIIMRRITTFRSTTDRIFDGGIIMF